MKNLDSAICYIKVDDDWSPNWSQNRVQAYITHQPISQFDFENDLSVDVYIVVRGKDDTIMRKEFGIPASMIDGVYQRANEYIKDLKELEPINKDFLHSEGFRYV